jgi:Right handed beta helix region
MSWGTRWIAERRIATVNQARRLSAAKRLATVMSLLVLVNIPAQVTVATVTRLPDERLVAEWSRSYEVATYQESSTRITYRGKWHWATSDDYLGRKARFANLEGSSATVRFTGTGISWIGPVGPTRGKAKVYVNGRYVKTVTANAKRFQPRQVLFTATYRTTAPRTFRVTVVGTSNHPTVAVDAFVVRGMKGGSPNPTAPRLINAPLKYQRVAGTPVPSSIDATGATDASAGLTAFVRTVPDGSTIVFKAGGVYRMDRGLGLANRHDLTFEGNGATLKSNGNGQSESTLVTLDRDSGITIRNLNLVGNSTTPGAYNPSNEGAHGIRIWDSDVTEISGVTISGVWGDCLYIGSWSENVRFHDSTCKSAGRMGVAITSGRNVTVQRATFGAIGYGVFDIEPNYSTEGATNVKFLGNTVGTIAQPRGKAFLFGAKGALGSTINGVTVDGNTVTGHALDTYVDLATRRQNIVFTNNTSKVAAAGPVLFFSNIDGLTVTGNVQALTSGVLASISDSTNVIYR